MKKIIITTVIFIASILLLYVIGLYVMSMFSYHFTPKPIPCFNVGESWDAELQKCTKI